VNRLRYLVDEDTPHAIRDQLLRRRASLGQILEDLLLIWEAGSPEDYRDRVEYLPL
jgi:hypothetical protein